MQTTLPISISVIRFCSNVGKYFDQTFTFIDAQLSRTNVLVHCFAGAQRSVTIIAAYLIRKWKKGADEVLAYIKERRKIAEPNEGFVKQLHDFATKINAPKAA
jgi:protein-tyrosine phosphatase